MGKWKNFCSHPNLFDIYTASAAALPVKKRKTCSYLLQVCTVKPVLSGHLKIDKTQVLMENGSLMKIASIAECVSHGLSFVLPSTISNIFSSETTGPIKFKFHIETP